MKIEKNIFYNSGTTPAAGDWHHQTDHAEYSNNLYYNFLDIPEDDSAAVVVNAGSRILKNPLGGPRQAGQNVHVRSCFEGFLPVNEAFPGNDGTASGQSAHGQNEKDFMGCPARFCEIGACGKPRE